MDTIGEVEDVRHIVAYQDHAQAALAKLPDYFEDVS